MSTINSETPDQGPSTTTTHSFDDSDTRADEMREQLDAWVEDLADLTDEAKASDQFQQWLDVQSKFHDYSARNTLLIKLQCPEATKVAGYQTWKDEFDRQVQAGEEAIWIWAPIITNKCPECGNSPSYHENRIVSTTRPSRMSGREASWASGQRPFSISLKPRANHCPSSRQQRTVTRTDSSRTCWQRPTNWASTLELSIHRTGSRAMHGGCASVEVRRRRTRW